MNEEKGPVKRRITQACILCRKKKIKCDGAKPECVHCIEANLRCQYTEYKKRGPHKGYVRLLEERLAQLESRLKSAGQEVPLPIIPPQSPIFQRQPDSTFQHHSHRLEEDDDLPPAEITTHLLELFFQYINSVFPLVHRGRLKQSIQDGNAPRPLIWSLMAIAARFSDHPRIRTNPPYWASERFAQKATSLISASLLEPTIPNLQFWGIMSCLEYGQASGSKAWTYGGIAVRICQELGLNKEETLKTPMYSAEGIIDHVAMALRRRIFWSVFCIDKFASTSTNRPQGFDIGDYDVEPPTLHESRLLRDPLQAFTIDRLIIHNDPLMDATPRYFRILERFGEICKYMSRAKTDFSSVTWPPIPEFFELDHLIKRWRDNLPDNYQFSQANLKLFRETASQNYLNIWLCSHAMYCTGMLALHRGSLAYSDLTRAELSSDTYERIQASIEACKVNVDVAMEVFQALHDICGCNVLPNMGYCAYIFSTVLMTSAFSSDPVAYSKSSSGLAILFDTIELLRPYWPMSERLANTTRDMLAAHSRLYEVQENLYEHKRLSNTKLQNSPDIDSLASIATPETSLPPPTNHHAAAAATPAYATNTNVNIPPQTIPPQQQAIQHQYPLQQQQGMNNNDIDFNSCEFLYDSTLFGQIIFDTKDLGFVPQQQQDGYMIAMNNNSNNNSYVLQPPQQYQQQHQNVKNGWRP